MTVAVTVKQLRTLLDRIAPHASNDDTLPMLNAIHLEARHGVLVAVASDRYTIAAARESAGGQTDGWTARISLRDLKAVRAWLGTHGRGTVVSLTTATAGDASTLTLTCGDSSIQTAWDPGQKFPGWRKIMANALQRDVEPVPVSGLGASLLARWGAVDAANGFTAWQAAPMAPLILATDDGFLGMQMPFRLPEERTRDSVIAPWLAVLTRQSAEVDGTTYDLTREWVDRDGDHWQYAGVDDVYGQPLMRVSGLDGNEHTLADLIAEFGPLTPA